MASLIIILLGTLAAAAQEPQTPESQNPRAGRMRVMPRERRLKKQRLDLAQRLQLSDDQKQQRKAIIKRGLLATKAQREQRFLLREKRRTGDFTVEDRDRAKQLRFELRKAMTDARRERLNVLTDEQKTRLSTLREGRKQRREERRKQRQEFRKNRPNG